MSKVKISLFELRAQSFQLAYNVKYDFSLSKTLIRLTQEYKINKPLSFQYRVFSLTWPAYMQIYWNKRKWSHKKRIQLPEDWFGTPTWPPFHCFVLGQRYGHRNVMRKLSIPWGLLFRSSDMSRDHNYKLVHEKTSKFPLQRDFSLL